jgi:single-stranded-DNA-specific exonuclease
LNIILHIHNFAIIIHQTNLSMRWKTIPLPPEEKINTIAQAIQVEKTIATLLVQRGIETYDQAKQFFRPSLKDLHNPYLMKDMDKAVLRIEKAIQKNENIMIFGDYDVDGTTAVSLVSSYLKSYYQNIATYIPDRYDEGYGISYKGIDFAHDNNITLIIALDCGIKSIDHVAFAKEKDIDFIICDHHMPGTILPDAVAILDPKRNDCNYPYKELCGCGVGFKLIQALSQNRNQTIEDLLPFLDLVATAIAADIVPITGENRILAKFGLEVINANPRPGIQVLIHNVKKKILTITDVVFIIAPRINAAGRIKHGNYAVELLTEFNLEQAIEFASQIEIFNADRKNLDSQITQEALIQIEKNDEKEKFTTVVYQENWHKGVIGIVASRLIETHYRPTIVFTKSGDKLAASARSVKGFDLYGALESSAQHLVQFGGHKYAAGMTLKEENYLAFKNTFENVVAQTILPEMQTPEIDVDLEIDLNTITDKFFRILKQFEPFGPDNMAPVFLTKNVHDTGYAKALGKDDEHLRLFVKQNNSEGFPAIAFGLGNKIWQIENQKAFNAVYTIDENEWNGNLSLQLRIKDIQTL